MILVPVGKATNLLSTDNVSSSGQTIEFEFDGPITKLYVSFELVKGSASSGGVSLYQSVISGPSSYFGSPGVVGVAPDTSTPGPGTADSYHEYGANLVRSGTGVFILSLSIFGGAVPYANLAVLGV